MRSFSLTCALFTYKSFEPTVEKQKPKDIHSGVEIKWTDGQTTNKENSYSGISNVYL